MQTRREFVVAAPLGLLGAVAACRGEAESSVASVPAPPSASVAPVATSSSGVPATTVYVVVGVVVVLGLGAGVLAGLMMGRRNRRW